MAHRLGAFCDHRLEDISCATGFTNLPSEDELEPSSSRFADENDVIFQKLERVASNALVLSSLEG